MAKKTVKTKAKRTAVKVKPVAFYKQPIIALSSSFGKVFSFFK